MREGGREGGRNRKTGCGRSPHSLLRRSLSRERERGKERGREREAEEGKRVERGRESEKIIPRKHASRRHNRHGSKPPELTPGGI